MFFGSTQTPAPKTPVIMDMQSIKAQTLENAKVAYPFYITNDLPRQPNNTDDDAYLRNPTFSIVTLGADTWCTARVIFDAPSGSGHGQQNRKVSFLESPPMASTGEALEKLLKLSEYVLLDAKEDISFQHCRGPDGRDGQGDLFVHHLVA